MLSRIFSLYRWVATAFLMVGCAGQVLTMLSRNTIKYQPDWMVEVSTLSLVFGSLLFIADVSDHLAFRGLSLALGERPRRVLRKVASILTAITMAVLGYFGCRAVAELWVLGSTTTTTLAFPLWLLYSTLPVVAFFWILRIVAELCGWQDENSEAPWSV